MNKKPGPRKAVLLVAFGKSAPRAGEIFAEIEKTIARQHDGIEIEWAFTSKTLRARAAALGSQLSSPETALSKLLDRGVSRVAVLALNIVAGQEFLSLCNTVERFQAVPERFEKIEMARPLLGNSEDMASVCEILAKKFSRQDADEGSIFVGHGNDGHPSDAVYTSMNSMLMAKRCRLFCGTVAGHPAPDELLPSLAAAGVSKVLLVPLMTLAGNHAQEDMAGSGPGSWKSVLSQNGIESEPVFTGLAEDPDIVALWMAHLEEAFSEL